MVDASGFNVDNAVDWHVSHSTKNLNAVTRNIVADIITDVTAILRDAPPQKL